MFHETEKDVRKMLGVEKSAPKLNAEGEPILDRDGHEVTYDPMPRFVPTLINRIEELITNKTTQLGISRETVALTIALSEHLQKIGEAMQAKQKG
jgi:hypothetical protein